MLLWHKHDVEKSLADLANFTPFPDEWTVEDKVLFEQAFGFHGKCFQRIQQMVRASAGILPAAQFFIPSGGGMGMVGDQTRMGPNQSTLPLPAA